MRNYKMIISYDGSRYRGWQRQSDTELTIQGTLERAISTYLGYDVTIDGSGRTDGGVHAQNQVANVKTSGKLEEGDFRDGLNQLLPEDIKIKDVTLVKNSFHSRHSAKGKHYTYRIDRRQTPCVFTRRYTYHYPDTLDTGAMRQAIKYLIGTHDFASVCDKKEEKSTVRTIYDIQLIEEKEALILEFYGNGFLNHMVRIITGTLLEVGAGKRPPESIPVLLKKKKRSEAGPIAPAQGLYMTEVYYDNVREEMNHKKKK